MVYAFQDRDNLYLIMDLMPGGDLRYHIGNYSAFPQNIVKFFVCCIIIGLEYLHSNYIIHRDIKPENLVIDEKGYLRITDLGIARIYEPNNYKNTSGTPGYMAPEVINRQNHSFCVDFFAVGVIAYECMLGKVSHSLFRGLTKVTVGRKSKTKSCCLKPVLKKHRFLQGGILKPLISSTGC
jgi:serine/threonine protein kinase